MLPRPTSLFRIESGKEAIQRFLVEMGAREIRGCPVKIIFIDVADRDNVFTLHVADAEASLVRRADAGNVEFLIGGLRI